jgi:hypothetical protein
MKIYGISRTKFFELNAQFPFIGKQLQHVGALWIDAWLSDEQAFDIFAKFPSAIFRK